MYLRRKTRPNSDTYQASISDLMSGLVFIFIITIVMFVIKFSDVTEKKSKALSEYSEIHEARSRLLKKLKQSLKVSGVDVMIDYENGILRLPEKTLFKSGESELKLVGRKAIRALSSNIKTLLNCKKPKIKKLCDGKVLKIEAIFIEGHSDNIRLGRRLKEKIESNLNLSVQRAINIYHLMEANIKNLKNRRDKYLFSVAGYGSRRPASKRPRNFRNLSRRARANYRKMNRRIDLRFVMSIPKFLTLKE